MQFTFTYPRLLFVGGGALLLGALFFWKYPKKTLPEFQFLHLVPKNKISRRYMHLYRFCLWMSFFCAFVVLSYPKLSHKEISQTKSGIDIILTLDVSFSMEATDLKPDRLTAAKKSLETFLSSRTTDRIGVVLFAGKPFVALPLSFDYPLIKKSISQISTGIIDQSYTHLQGSAIGDALLSSITLLQQGNTTGDDERSRSIILVTDGEANIGIDPLIVAQLAKEQHIIIYSIGIGSYLGGTIAFGDMEQEVVGVDEPTLRHIAELTSGIYARADDADSLKNIIDQIEQLTRTEVSQEEIVLGYDLRQPIAFVGFICMFIVIFLDRKLMFS